MIRFKCPQCEKVLGVKDHLAGKRVQCPNCKAPITIPAPQAAATVDGNGAPPAMGLPADKPAAPKEPPVRLPFICPSCHEKLKIPPELAGRQRPCPRCKSTITIPKVEDLKALAASQGSDSASAGIDLEDLAASAFADSEAQAEAAQVQEKINMTCPWCDEQVQFNEDSGGKQEPCPKCRRIIKVPKIVGKEKKDWREKAVTGPSLAKESQPKVEDAWEGRRKTVSGTSLVEAGAVPVKTEPVPTGTWVRRGVITFVVLAIVVFGFWGARLAQLQTRLVKARNEALATFDKAKDKMPRGWAAQFYLGVGESYVREEKPGEAEKSFRTARLQFPINPLAKNGPGPEEELLLVDIALAQIAMGGNEEQVLYKKRIGWPDVQKELDRTISSIKTDEGKLLALRKISLKLLELNQGNTALGLATQVAIAAVNAADPNEKPIVLAEQVALLVVLKQNKDAEKIEPAPKGNETAIKFLPRLAYAQASSYEGDFDRAKKLALLNGPAKDRFHTLLAITDIALTKNQTDEAKGFLEEAKKLATENPNLKKISSVLMLQFVSLAAQLDFSENWETWLKRIPDLDARASAQLAILKAQAAREKKFLDPSGIDNRKAPAYPQAFLHMARHKSHQGYEDEVLNLINNQDENIRPFLHLGIALGIKDEN